MRLYIRADYCKAVDPDSQRAMDAKRNAEIKRAALAQQRAIEAKRKKGQRAIAANADVARREADARHAKKERAKPLQPPGSPFD